MDKKEAIEAIIEKFFQGAPPNLIKPQLADIELLNADQLELILEIESFPLHDDERHLLSHLISKDFLIRLEEKIETYKIVKEAAIDGPYGAGEQLALEA